MSGEGCPPKRCARRRALPVPMRASVGKPAIGLQQLARANAYARTAVNAARRESKSAYATGAIRYSLANSLEVIRRLFLHEQRT
jgi:hypothetical protein